ncbi:TetR/AcrR family transcriptional regulator [Pseudomaricurvus alkylphenolicus]|uniref:TetR/AcrR family transcriptional regulator n=1 Tax=Pseudomaricurvus alkylphenolicus TaxID=1306991 RepID=UPI00142424CF|nr:TetR/AcrR family transcriptional regulator [Pseudomaricurvus alkylphenolicus]NIB42312.1 TetR/AcrR family transcriptional regulator [Pseudomaricurvus alkylphenolicus]
MTTSSLELPSVKVPQQKRSREKYEAMVRAAEKLFAKQGVQETSVQDIVGEAGVSVGAFYQRFENKEAMIHTIFYQLEEEIVPLAEDLEGPANQTLSDTLKSVVNIALSSSRAHRAVLVAMLMEVERNPNIRNYVTHLRRKMGAVYTQALLRHANEITLPNIKQAAAMTNRIIYSYLTQVLLYEGNPETEKMLRHTTSDKELVKMLHAYLTVQ